MVIIFIFFWRLLLEDRHLGLVVDPGVLLIVSDEYCT